MKSLIYFNFCFILSSVMNFYFQINTFHAILEILFLILLTLELQGKMASQAQTPNESVYSDLIDPVHIPNLKIFNFLLRRTEFFIYHSNKFQQHTLWTL